MKTYAYINTANEVKGIGMIYFESGELLPEIAKLVQELGEDAGIKQFGETVCPRQVLEDETFGERLYTTVVIDTTDLPNNNDMSYDKTFMKAWEHKANKPIIVNLTKAIEVTKDRLRAEREPLLEALDVQTMMNMANPIKLAEIEAKKQALRDVTKLADGVKSVEALKAINVE